VNPIYVKLADDIVNLAWLATLLVLAAMLLPQLSKVLPRLRRIQFARNRLELQIEPGKDDPSVEDTQDEVRIERECKPDAKLGIPAIEKHRGE
jgi:hypothetical protein